jgi:medium-chain acyl-[acyl-carrier-protein] hydrolase
MNRATDADTWLSCPRQKPDASVFLICFPYAGGSPAAYYPWAAALPDSINVCSVHLPGRGTRLREEPFNRMASLVPVLTDVLTNFLSHAERFAFFGHSLGASIAFEIVRELRRRGQSMPTHLFVSGSRSPQEPYTDHIHGLPEAEFLEEIRQMGGTPPEILNHKELMALLLPTMRADFAIRETYAYHEEPPLPCPITAFGGLTDYIVAQESLEDWRTQTARGFSLHMFPGDHFFPFQSQASLLEMVSQRLVSQGKCMKAGENGREEKLP